jgi:hypothetical protein
MKASLSALAMIAFGALPVFAGERPVTVRACTPTGPYIVRQLQDIRIPKVELRDVTVAEALEFLRQRSRELDPSGAGVNIVLKEAVNPAPPK